MSASINFTQSSASWWNPIDLGYRWLYTGDAFAPDNVYDAATDGGGENYTANKAAAHQAIDAASIIDPTPLSDAVNATLYSIEGDFENAKSTAKWAAAGPVGDVIRLARNGKKGLDAAQQLGEQLGKNSDKADDVVEFGDGVVAKAPKTGGAGSVRAGQAGEAAVGDIGLKTKISINGRKRIPDGIDTLAKTLSEVKNVKKLSYTQQLRDYAQYAKENGLRFDLYVPRSTAQNGLSGPLQQAIQSGDINLRLIPGT